MRKSLLYEIVIVIVMLLPGRETLQCQIAPETKSSASADSNDYLAHYNNGVKLTLEKKYDDALAAYRTALEIYPRHSEAHYAVYCNEILKDTSLLTELSMESPSPEKAAKVAEIKEQDNLAFYNDPFYDRSMGGLFIKGEVFYIPIGYRASARFGYTHTLYLKLDGFNKFFHGEYARAIADFSIMIDDYPDFTQGHYLRGLAYARLHAYDLAIEDFKYVIGRMAEYNKTKILPIYLNSAHLHYMIGCAYLQMRRYYPAEAAFKAALAEDLGLYMVHFQLSIVDLLKGSYVPALSKLDAAIAMRPDDAILHSNKGSMLAQQQRFEEALNELKIAQSIIPRYPPLYYNLGNVYMNLGRKADALDHFKRYVAIASLRDSVNIQRAEENISQLSQ